MPDPVEKKLAKLRKKLQAVETLKEQRDRGEKLEANQVREGVWPGVWVASSNEDDDCVPLEDMQR